MQNYIPKDQRKKILLMCDDIRMPSGIGTVGKELIINYSNITLGINNSKALLEQLVSKKIILYNIK